jgi:hypothetical protein
MDLAAAQRWNVEQCSQADRVLIGCVDPRAWVPNNYSIGKMIMCNANRRDKWNSQSALEEHQEPTALVVKISEVVAMNDVMLDSFEDSHVSLSIGERQTNQDQ